MRILVVSAHYPPNFVSGGTLQPQRLARGLRERGHDVSVYAGWLGRRDGLAVWDDIDETGLPIHWISIGPFIGWSDERNFDHPEVRDEFARYLADAKPDVVHLHSLQALGAGLVRAAKDAGSRVVVTMHDFWWLCARQFLVDRCYTPCSLVVSCGVCECQVDRRWLQHRDRFLGVELAAADLVLAPSASAAEVFAANGIDPAKLRVDENGLVDWSPRKAVDFGREPRPRTPVRFAYTGGPNEMKGIHVLLQAARQFGVDAGLQIVAYGIQEYLDRTGDVVPPVVEVRPAFEPAELDAVMADTDVLVIPSVMRETHSLVTREALERGLPVICTDSLGPEEVVVPERNGLIVPSADPAALAAALRRVVTEKGLAARLAAGAREQPVKIRSLSDQVDGLDTMYRELMLAARESPTVSKLADDLGRVVFIVGIEGAPLRYRARLPAEALGLLGVEATVVHYRDERLARLLDDADAVVVYRVPATLQILDLIDRTRVRGIPVLFDVDDLIFDPSIADEIPALRLLPAEEAALWLDGVRRYRTTLEHCDGYIGSTQMLVEHAASVTGLPTARFDNGVGTLLGQASDRALRRPRRQGPVRLGYFSGTITHDDDWFYIEPAVADVLGRNAQAELWLGGYLPDTPALAMFGDRVVRVPFVSWLELPARLRDLDVNLAPLAPGGRFNEAKSAIKWLEAALVGTPTVASPTQPFREAIDNERTGLLAKSPDEWASQLHRLVADELFRATLGAAARRRALLQWSPHRQGVRYLQILRDAASWSDVPRPASKDWIDVAHEEPLGEFPLEGYEPLAAESAAPVHDGNADRGERRSLRRLALGVRDRVSGAGSRT